MPQPERVGSLEITQDLDFQRREWVVQRVAWAVVAALLIAGVVGLFGAGPLSHAVASSGPLTLEYDRLLRRRAPSQYELAVSPDIATAGEVALWLDAALLEKIDIDQIVPEPTEAATGSDRIVYRFAVADPEQTAQITFHLEPSEPGAVRGRIGLIDGQELTIDQFIYP